MYTFYANIYGHSTPKIKWLIRKKRKGVFDTKLILMASYKKIEHFHYVWNFIFKMLQIIMHFILTHKLLMQRHFVSTEWTPEHFNSHAHFKIHFHEKVIKWMNLEIRCGFANKTQWGWGCQCEYSKKRSGIEHLWVKESQLLFCTKRLTQFKKFRRTAFVWNSRFYD